jgi:hypothetical protein
MGLFDNIGGDGATLALQIAVALSLLMLGRRLYWLFVAGVGFVVTLALATEYIDVGPDWMALALGIVAGIAGALFAVFLQKLAVGMAGFAASAYFAYEIAGRLGMEGNAQSVGVLVAGVLGAIFASILFDWALILLSSVAGAVLLVDSFVLDDVLALVVMTVLAIAGIAIQSNMLHREGEK